MNWIKQFNYVKYIFTFLITMVCSSAAADQYYYPSYDSSCCDISCCDTTCCDNPWNGLYVSGKIGTGWGRNHLRFKNANYFNTAGPVVLGSNFNFKKNGVVGGGGLGYNYQCGSIVLGVESAALLTHLKHTRNSPFFPDSDRFSSSLRWMTTIKGRIGFTYDCFLAYASGGWAGGYFKLKLSDTIGGVRASSKKWVNGWTVGGGLEYRMTQAFSFGLAYNYAELEYTKTISCPSCGVGVGLGAPKVKSRFHVQNVLFSINYHL